jgi:hypothetical protein
MINSLSYNGFSRNSPSYGLSQNGCGKCLNLTYLFPQCAQISYISYIDLYSISFLMESWTKPSIVGNGNEHAIFGQCPLLSQALALHEDNQSGSLIIPINHWSHVAPVYCLTSQTMSLYINGTLDVSNSDHSMILM